jgi:hypothetical protein
MRIYFDKYLEILLTAKKFKGNLPITVVQGGIDIREVEPSPYFSY